MHGNKNSLRFRLRFRLKNKYENHPISYNFYRIALLGL